METTVTFESNEVKKILEDISGLRNTTMHVENGNNYVRFITLTSKENIK